MEPDQEIPAGQEDSQRGINLLFGSFRLYHLHDEAVGPLSTFEQLKEIVLKGPLKSAII